MNSPELFGFFVFLCFYEVILALEKSPEKYNRKNSNGPEINSKLLFSGKMAPENTFEIEGFLVALPGPDFTGFLHGFKNVHAHWLSLVSLVVGFWDVLLPLL